MSIKPNNSCTALTVWNKRLGRSSLFPQSKLTNIQRAMIQLTPRVKSIIVGIILSDGWLQKRGDWNPSEIQG